MGISGWAKPWEESHGKVKSGFVPSLAVERFSTFLDGRLDERKKKSNVWKEIVVLENPSLVMGFLLEIFVMLICFNILKTGVGENHVTVIKPEIHVTNFTSSRCFLGFQGGAVGAVILESSREGEAAIGCHAFDGINSPPG